MIACAILHNICKDRKIPIPDDGDDEDEDDDNVEDQNQTKQVNDGRAQTGVMYRQQFAMTHF